MTIRTKQHEILDLGVTTFLRSINDVVKSRLAFGRNLQTHCERLACGSSSIRFLLGQVAKRITALVLSFSFLRACTFRDVFFYVLILTLFLWCEIAIRLALFEQAVRGSAMRGRIVRREDEILIVIESEPLEAFYDRACG